MQIPRATSLATGADDLAPVLLAIERLVDSRLRAARTERAAVSIETIVKLTRPASEPSGTATALRYLLVVRRLTLLAHPKEGPGIIRAAEGCDPVEVLRLWRETQGQATGPIPEGATLN